MQTLTATARQGECLDALVWRLLQAGSGVVEQVFDLNPGIADTADALAEGRVVVLPVILVAQPDELRMVKLWD